MLVNPRSWFLAAALRIGLASTALAADPIEEIKGGAARCVLGLLAHALSGRLEDASALQPSSNEASNNAIDS